ncbi:hypothetical protein ACFLRN_02885 [Thermoproteota archaeon]
MNKKKSLVIGLLLVLSTIICFNINPISAQTRQIDSIDHYFSGTDLILNITASHQAPQADPGVWGMMNHIDRIEIDLDGDINTVGDVVTVNTASIESTHFSVQYNMGEVTGNHTVYARAIDNVGTLGAWKGPVVVPEFSLFLLVPFFIVGSIAVLLIKSKITAKVPK